MSEKTYKTVQYMRQQKFEKLQELKHEEMTASQIDDYNTIATEINELNWSIVEPLIQPLPNELPNLWNETSSSQVNDETQADPILPVEIKKTEEQPSKPIWKGIAEVTQEFMDKVNAIFDMLPMIRETYMVAQFMLENRGFNTAYKGYMDKDSQRRKTEELYAVLDYYGILHSDEKNVEVLKKTPYAKLEHIDTICKYLVLEWIAYDREDFILKPIKNEEERRDWQPRTNPQATTWTP